MRVLLVLALGIGSVAAPAVAGSQSSNTSSNSSSNNGVTRERVIDTYCEDGWCERHVSRRIYRDRQGRYHDGRRWYHSDRGRRYRDRDDD